MDLIWSVLPFEPFPTDLEWLLKILCLTCGINAFFSFLLFDQCWDKRESKAGLPIVSSDLLWHQALVKRSHWKNCWKEGGVKVHTCGPWKSHRGKSSSAKYFHQKEENISRSERLKRLRVANLFCHGRKSFGRKCLQTGSTSNMDLCTGHSQKKLELRLWCAAKTSN